MVVRSQTSDGISSKNRSSDRVLVLKLIDGKKPLDSIGLVDKRLFTGENKLHAIMDTQTCMWTLKYDMGGLPQPLKQRFTTFTKLLEYTRNYWKTRNIEISEVQD